MRYFIPCLFVLTACQSEPDLLPHTEFAANLVELCGQSFEGEVVSTDPEDADWRGKTLTVGPIDCTEVEVKMPLAVGEDQSREWRIMPTSVNNEFIKLTHIHTLKDGSPDPVSEYGGKTITDGTATRQEFPADEFSKTLFRENGLDASVGNVWALEITPDELLAYELNREGRHFRAEFNLSDPS